MAERRSVIRPIVFALCVAFTVSGLLNVYGNNADVQRKAEAVACREPQCSLTLTRMARSPFSQSFTFATQAGARRGDAVSVECKREFLLIGEYMCALSAP